MKLVVSAPGQFDHGEYDAMLFVDSMIPLEGRPLPELPCDELNLGSRILLLVVPQVLQEVDKRKRDGRLGKRAREFRRLVEPVALSGKPIRLTEGPPSVDLALARSGRIGWNRLDDLDPGESDAKVVAQVLHEQVVPDDRKVLFIQDMLQSPWNRATDSRWLYAMILWLSKFRRWAWADDHQC